jgi:hypothetical protein
MTNVYSEIVKSKSTDELLLITSKINMYQSTLVDAAKQELLNRGIDFSEQKVVENKKDEMSLNENIGRDTRYHAMNGRGSKRKGAFAINLSEVEEGTAQQKIRKSIESNYFKRHKDSLIVDCELPQLYSKRAILICTSLCSVLLGGILFALNLKVIKKSNQIHSILIFYVAFVFVDSMLTRMFGGLFGLIVFFPLNIVGGIVLSTVFWDKYIGDSLHYEPKSVLVPVLLNVLVCILLIVIFVVFGLMLISSLRNIG